MTRCKYQPLKWMQLDKQRTPDDSTGDLRALEGKTTTAIHIYFIYQVQPNHTFWGFFHNTGGKGDANIAKQFSRAYPVIHSSSVAKHGNYCEEVSRGSRVLRRRQTSEAQNVVHTEVSAHVRADLSKRTA